MPVARSQKCRIAAKAAGIIITACTAASGLAAAAAACEKVPMHTSKLRGQDWVEELLHGHDGRFYNQMGMHKHVFKQLLRELQWKVDLDSSKYITIEEQVAIFLYVAVTGQSNRKVQERFQRSGDTISK